MIRSVLAYSTAIMLASLGIFQILSPVRYSKFLHSLAEPQIEILRGGRLFDICFPERVERSRPLRTQIRLLGILFFAIGLMLVFQK